MSVENETKEPEPIPEKANDNSIEVAEVADSAAPPSGRQGPAAGNDQVDRLGTDKVSKLIMQFAIPSIVGMLANGLYNIIDGIFMGHGVGPIGLATATVSMPIMTFSMAVSMLLGGGGNALVALRLGEGKKDEAERILGICFTLFVIAGLFCTTMIQLFMEPLVRLSGASDDIIDSCTTFIRIVSAGISLQFFGMGFNNFIRTSGAPKRALLTMITGISVSTALNWLFVLQLHWGVAGSAWATVAGQASSCFMVMHYFFISKKAPFKLHLRNMPIIPKVALNIITLGSASFFMQIAMAMLGMFTNNLIVHYGTLSPIGLEGALAALGVVARVQQFSFFPIMGCAVAAQPLIGYNYGAKNYPRVKRAYWTAFVWMISFGTFFWILVHAFPEQIAFIFGVKEELLEYVAHALRIQLMMLPVMGMQPLSANFFQSTGQPLKSLLLSLTRQILYMVPLIYFLPIVLPMLFPDLLIGLDGIIFAYPCSDTLSVLTAALLIRREFKIIDRKAAALATEQPGLVAEAI